MPPAPSAHRPEPLRPGPGATSRPAPRTRLLIEGMTCGNCVRHAAEALQSTPGVASATVDFNTGTASVDWSNVAAVRPELLFQSLRRAGFQAREWVAKPNEPPRNVPGTNPWSVSLRFGIPASVLLMVGDWLLDLGLNPTFQSASFLVAVATVWLLGRRFYQGAWNQLRSGGANMDTLVSLGVTAAMGYSVVTLFSNIPGHRFFTESVTLLTFVGVGHFLEHRMSARAGSALRSLLELAPATANRLDLSGNEQAVAVGELALEDRIVLRPGDRVPVDAIVIEGNSAIDESMLTGESMPVDKKPGSRIYAGTSNRSGNLTAVVSGLGEETALARIAEVIRRAQSTRASVQRLADRISAVFVPIVVGVAVAAALWWFLFPASAGAARAAVEAWLWHAHLPNSPIAAGIVVACSVLVIACPCAMGLATPVALMAGVNTAARHGILVRDAAVLETCGGIDTLIFDKTGTLTLGRPAVVESAAFVAPHPSPQPLPHAFAELAASLARRSNHPLSLAIAQVAPGNETLLDWTELPGAGLRARWKNHVVRLGSPSALNKAGIESAFIHRIIHAWAEQGSTPVLLAIDQTLIAAFALRDSLRPEAREVIARLRRDGYRVGLLSGDHPVTAKAVALEAGIDPTLVHAGIPPEGKSGFLEALRKSGRHVAFVGDGINDGPALAAADLGIAVARASDVAREAAGIVLLRTNLHAVPEALHLASATLRTIRQNLFWAFFYNAAAVPLAALGLVNPAVCAAAMGLSDLVVVGNALRLSRKAIRNG